MCKPAIRSSTAALSCLVAVQLHAAFLVGIIAALLTTLRTLCIWSAAVAIVSAGKAPG